jgi:hypothetical protein
LADRLAIVEDVADRAVGTVLGLLDRFGVGLGEDVLLLDDRATALHQLVDPVQLHAESPPISGRC